MTLARIMAVGPNLLLSSEISHNNKRRNYDNLEGEGVSTFANYHKNCLTYRACYLAILDNYHLTRKNANFHIVIWHGHPWGGRFQMAGVGERLVAGANGRGPSGQEGWLCSGYGRFLAM